MDLIHRLLNIVLPILSVILFIFLLPAVSLFKLFNYFVRSVFPEKLAGKVVLITGASSGIGEYVAYEYAKRGARLALIARREEQLEIVAVKARELGSPDVIVFSADVSKVDDCNRFVAQTVNHFGSLDHLVNNAGIATLCLVQDQRSISDYASIMDINFWGSVYTTQFAVPHLRKRKGKIIVISSAGGWLTLPRLSVYNASKAALTSFYETLRVEVGSDIGITIVTPGLVKSSMTNDKVLLQANIKWVPLMSTKGCAKAILESVRRGDEYSTEPGWVRVLFLWKMFCPELVNWINRFLHVKCSNVSLLTSKSD